MGSYVDLFIITATTVGKIMLCAVAGMFASRYFVAPEKSEKGLSYISVRILLPCLLFSNLCLSVTVESVRKFYWAPLLACLPLGLGLASSFLFRIILEKKYHALIMLGCTFQNGLTFPLSIIVNLKGVSWLDSKAAADAQSYIFLYNIVCSIGLWAVGEPLIAAAKAKERAAEEAVLHAREKEREKLQDRLRGVSGDGANRSFAFPFQEQEMAARVRANSEKDGRRRPRHTSLDEAIDGDDTQKTDGNAESGDRGPHRSREEQEPQDGSDPHKDDDDAHMQKRNATATEQLAWYKPAKPYDAPLKPPKPAQVYTDDHGQVIVIDPEEEEAVKHNQCSVSRVNGILARSFKSPTVFFSFVGIAVSLIPPLRWIAESFVGQTLIGGLTVVGSGAIPLQLLVLGCTIASNKPKEDDEESQEITDTKLQAQQEQEASADASGGVVVAEEEGKGKRTKTAAARVNECVKPSTVFVACSVTLRMVILPGVCFLVIHLLNTAGLLPNERPFLIAMLVATSSPSAINSSVICSMHDYHSREYARMIFFMYITAIFSTAVYLFFFILYLGW